MLTEEQIEEQLSNLSRDELDRLVSNIQKITLLVGKRELQKALSRKLARFEKRLAAVEKWQKKPGIRKSVVGQDTENEADNWPSLDGLIL